MNNYNPFYNPNIHLNTRYYVSYNFLAPNYSKSWE